MKWLLCLLRHDWSDWDTKKTYKEAWDKTGHPAHVYKLVKTCYRCGCERIWLTEGTDP